MDAAAATARHDASFRAITPSCPCSLPLLLFVAAADAAIAFAPLRFRRAAIADAAAVTPRAASRCRR